MLHDDKIIQGTKCGSTPVEEKAMIALDVFNVKVESDKAAQWNLEVVLKRISEKEPEDYVNNIKRFLSHKVKRAKRLNVWRKFSSLGRNFISLCISLPIKFKGKELLRALVKTLKELVLLLNPVYRFWFKGRDLACKICEAAYVLGCKDALTWRYDRNFAIYWGMVSSSGFIGGGRC